jgi:hypothetical protein
MEAVATPRLAGASDADLARNLDLVRAAIDLIASGGADRITLVGLADSAKVLPKAQALSRSAGLQARADWHPGDDGCDITVEGPR